MTTFNLQNLIDSSGHWATSLPLHDGTAALDRALDRLEGFVRDDLPTINTNLETTPEPDLLVRAAVPLLAPIVAEAAHFANDRARALKTIQLLGFVGSSLERHMQRNGAVPGSGVIALGLPGVLSDLARAAHHPARDSALTYWLLNRGPKPLTFTTDNGELLFNKIVNLTHDKHASSNAALRQICGGELRIEDARTVEVIKSAVQNTNELVAAYRSFMTRQENGDWAMTPMFFMRRMRTYLPTYPVVDDVWSGVNAAHVWKQICVDYNIGTVDDDYWTYVLSMFDYFPPEGWDDITLDARSPSIFGRILAAMHVSRADFTQLTDAQLARLLGRQPAAVRAAGRAYTELVETASKLTSIHRALIQNYLIRPAQSLTAEELATLGVAPSEGTGGRSHDDTLKLWKMRTEHPLISRLVNVARGNQRFAA